MSGSEVEAAKILAHQSRCPVCGAGVCNGGGGAHFASATFSCGAMFETYSAGVRAIEACPCPSNIAAAALTREAGILPHNTNAQDLTEEGE
jgi:hypothetical protein